MLKKPERVGLYIFLFLLLCDAVCIFSFIATHPRKYIFQHFESNTLSDYYSVGKIFFIACVNALIVIHMFISRHTEPLYKKQLFWVFSCLFFIYASLDELFFFHGHIDWRIHAWLNMKETALTDRIDDLIVFFYAIGAFFTLYYYRKEVQKYKGFMLYALMGISLGAIAAVLDAIANRKDILYWVFSEKQVAINIFAVMPALEECSEIVASGFILTAFLLVLIARVKPSLLRE
jgi:hypothetical protein